VRSILASTLRQSLAASSAVIIVEYLLRLDLSRPFLALFFALQFLAIAALRLLARSLGPHWWRGLSASRHLIVAGSGEPALRLAGQVESSSRYGIHLLCFLDEQSGSIPLTHSTYPVRPFSDLPEILRTQPVDEIVFAVDSERLASLEDLFLLCDEEGVRTRVTVDFFPHLHSRVYLERLGETPLLTFTGGPHDELRLMLKRWTDFILASAALLVISPLLLLIAIFIKLTSKGPVVFSQQRCGLNGRRFTLYKFRTMVADAEQRKAELAHLNVKTTAFKIPNDPRLTPIGKWLRKFSLDEFPQLWNVVRGEMSLVGPRPAVPEEVVEYKRWQRRRLRMRPGLTCLWTLAGRDALEFDEWMKLDLAYIDTWSLALDWSIMLRTVPYVLTGKGAH
jgi:exopolysaccharide biosynthesis polyprenyl glycosylphosphotransferase